MKNNKVLKSILAIVLCFVIVLMACSIVALTFHHHDGCADCCPICRAILAINFILQTGLVYLVTVVFTLIFIARKLIINYIKIDSLVFNMVRINC